MGENVISDELKDQLGRAAGHLVAFAGRRPGRPPFSPAGFRTAVQYQPPHYRVGRQQFAHGEDPLAAPVSETTIAVLAQVVLAAGWLAEMQAMPPDEFKQAANAVYMTSVIEPPP